MSQGLMPSCASSTILSLMWLGRGRPLTNTPPSWFTSPYAFTWDGSEMYTSEVLTVDQWESKFCSTQYGVLESGFVRIAATNCFYETNWGFTDRLELQNFAVWWVWANIPLTLAILLSSRSMVKTSKNRFAKTSVTSSSLCSEYSQI